MTLEDAINKARKDLGFNGTVHLEAAATQPEKTDTLPEDTYGWVKDYVAKLESSPGVQRTRQILMQAAVEKERAEMGFPTLN